MTAPLVVTKYMLPPSRPRQVLRERLMRRLLAGLDRKLTLIAAPAGFGKSTIAVALARAADRPVAWISLDEADNDPMRWGAYLIAAVRHVGVPIDAQVEALAGAGEHALDALVGLLINAVAAAGSQLLLVMDDYHLIHAAEIHEAVAFLLQRLATNMHVVIVTRSRPPLPLAQLKVRGELSELTATDLRFTPDEGSAFLHSTMGLNLPAHEAYNLVDRTEGWAAALQLAALSLQGDSTASISANHPDLVAYLMGEVLDQLPAQIHTFLLQTAILDPLTGPLCTAVTGQADGDRTLKALEQANLLIFPLDADRRAYRYHSLFAEFLRSQLPDGASAALHVRAAEWYHAHGQVAEAVDHLVAGAQFERAADWLEDGLVEQFDYGSPVTLVRWIDRFPQPLLRGRPHLAALAAWAMVATGDVQTEQRFAQATAYLDMAELAIDQSDATRGLIAAVRTALALWAPVRQLPICIMQDAARTLQCAQQAQQLLPADSWFWRSVVSNSLGSIYLRAGNVAAAAQAFGEAARLGARAGSLSAALSALRQQAELLILLGQPADADETYQAALRLAADTGGEALPTLAPIYLGLGRLRFARSDLHGSAQMLAEASTRYAMVGDAPPELLLALAQLEQARGETAAARDHVDQAADLLARRSKLRAASAAVWPDAVIVLLAQGDTAAARRWVEAAGVAADSVPDLGRAPEHLDLRRAPEHLALARLLVAERNVAAALPVLAAVQQVAAATGCRALAAEALKIESLATGDTPDAAGVEPLTEREREIIALIATGCSNQDVATQLIMGVSTVKWHLINIYGKLEVRSRTQAVARARTLGLV